jgi:hypothetical protein
LLTDALRASSGPCDAPVPDRQDPPSQTASEDTPDWMVPDDSF